MTITFDEATHTYRLDGHRIPSVTQIIKVLDDTVWSRQAMANRDYAADVGHAVHLTCELDDKEDLDEEYLDPTLAGYLAAWRKFREDKEFIPSHIEMPVVSEKRRFAGRIDRLGVWTVYPHRELVLVDIKSGAFLPAYTAVQLVGYALALEEMGVVQEVEKITHLAAVQLQPTGRYILHRYPNDSATRAVFLAALTVWNYREANR